jgi:hypothetical protein
MAKTRSQKRISRRKSMRGGETPEEAAAREKRMADFKAREAEIERLKAERANLARDAEEAQSNAERLRQEADEAKRASADAAAAAPIREGLIFTPAQLNTRVKMVFGEGESGTIIMAALRGEPIDRKGTIKIHPDQCKVTDAKYKPVCSGIFALFGDPDEDGKRKIEDLAAAQMLFRDVRAGPPPRKSAPTSTAGRRRRSRKDRRYARRIR